MGGGRLPVSSYYWKPCSLTSGLPVAHSDCTSVKSFNPLTPTSDQDRISPYNITTISSRQVMRIKTCKLGNYWLIQDQILQTAVTSQ